MSFPALVLAALLTVPVLPLQLSAAPVLQRQAETLQAAGSFVQAAAAWQQILGPDDRRPLDHDRALALVRLAICLRAAGDDGRAEPLLQRIIALDASVVKRGDSSLPRAFLVLASIESQRQRPDLAEALFGHGWGLSVAALGDDHETSRNFLWGLLGLAINAQRQAEGEDPPDAGPDQASPRQDAIQRTAREWLQP